MGSDSRGDPLPTIFEPIRLPCGREVQNRLVKVALYEHLSPMWGGLPNAFHHALYSQWSKGQWGMILTGNVQVSPTHLSLGRDIIVPETITPETLGPFKRLADIIHGAAEDGVQHGESQTLAIMQLSHGGRQSPSLLGGRPLGAPALAPSSVRLGSESSKEEGILSRLLYGLLFPTPKEMTISEIDDVVDAFVRGARVAMESGFDGIELHAAHGYLLAEFISTKNNTRQDEYSSITSPLRLIHRIATRVREIAPDGFIVGVKLSAADYVESGSHPITDSKHNAQEDRALSHVTELASWGIIDFIEVSGGDYENPEFISASRQAVFSRFSRRAMEVLSSGSCGSRLPPRIILTGGLRSPSTFVSALADDHTHLLGIGRLSVLCPDLPLQLKIQGNEFDTPEPDLSESIWDQALAFIGKVTGLRVPKLIGAGRQVSWYGVQLREIANGREPDYSVGGLGGMLKLWLWQFPDHTKNPRTGNIPLFSVMAASVIVLVLVVNI